MRRNKGLAVTLEQHTPTEGEGKKEDIDYSATAEAKELDSKKSAKKSDDLHEDVDTATESLENIYNLVDSLEAFNQAGGLDQNGAGLLKMLANEYAGKAGLDADDYRVVSSLEAFGSTGRKTEAVTTSMEGLGEMAKDVWAKIVAALKKLKEWFLKQFYHYFGEAETLLKRAKALAGAGRSLGARENATFDDKGLLNAIKINGKAPSLADVEHFASYAQTSITKLMGMDVAGDVTVEKPSAKGAIEKITAAAPMEGAATGGSITGAEGDTIQRSKRLPGDKALYLIEPKQAGEGAAAAMRALSHLDLKLAPYDKKGSEEAASASLPTLTGSDATRIGSTLETLLAEIVANRKNMAKVEADQNKLISEAEKEMNKGAADADSQEKREELRAAQAMLSNVRNYTIRPLGEMIDYALSTSRRLLEYGEKSLAQYKKAA